MSSGAVVPKVSVIVPVYNVEKYLRRCLDSLVGQTLEDIEVVAVNDASPDGSLAILHEYAARYPDKVVVIDSPENRRQGGARNLGLDVARGEYVTFVDSDDWLDTSMLEKLYTEAVEHDADMVDCDCAYFDGEDKPQTWRQNWADDLIGPADGDVRDRRIARGGGVVAKIIRRSIFTDNDLRFPEHMTSEDAISPYIWYLADHVAKVREPLYIIRRDNVSTTRARNSAHLLDGQDASQLMLRLFKDKGLYAQHKDAVDYIFLRGYYTVPIVTLLFKFDPPGKRQLQETRAYVRASFPRYRRNRFYPQMPRGERILALLNDLSPTLLCWGAVAVQRVFGSRLPWYFRPGGAGTTA